VRIFTLNGRIIRTIGLPHNFELQNYSNEFLLASNSSYELVNLYNPDAFSLKMERRLLSKDSILKKFDALIDVNIITENFNIESIGWGGNNYYIQNKDTMQIERLEQDIHPRLPTLKVEYYLKY